MLKLSPRYLLARSAMIQFGSVFRQRLQILVNSASIKINIVEIIYIGALAC